MDLQELATEGLQDLPPRWETSVGSPTIIVNTQIAIALNVANFGESKGVDALNTARVAAGHHVTH
jgi:hypothetical protein